jgi:transposase InsO family protein
MYYGTEFTSVALDHWCYWNQVRLDFSRPGKPTDSAACAGFFGRLKNELFCARDWLNTTIDEFTTALATYIRWYNKARIKISLGSRSPVEYRKSLGIAV